MKKGLFLSLLIFPLWGVLAQNTPFQVYLEEISISGAPALQSYVWATQGEDWLFAGGLVNGLHDHRPPFSFQAVHRNNKLHVVNYETNSLWDAPLSGLPPALAEQLSSTNMQFIQVGEWLYAIGGYGYDAVSAGWITHPKLAVFHVPGVIAAIKAGGDLAPHIRQLDDDIFAVTGGQLGWIDGEFYLVGGQRFDGRYNPNNGPSFVQEYTYAIRRFKILDADGQLSVADFSETTNLQHLRRRDYNMLPQIFPNGEFGYTVFTGVFRPDVDLPWLNTVDVRPGGYAVIADFEQLFNQYHTAHFPVYDQAANAMHSFFFGGIALYYIDEEGGVMLDSLVPFVKQVSRVTRAADGSMTESVLDFEMPGFLGASAEFIPMEGLPQAGKGVIDLQALPEEPVLVGHIYGGIESEEANIFMQFSGESVASKRIFRVWLHKGTTGVSYKVSMPGAEILRSVYPNPATDTLMVEGEVAPQQMTRLRLIDAKGRIVKEQEIKAGPGGEFIARMGLRGLPRGMYFLSAQAGDQTEIKRVAVK